MRRLKTPESTGSWRIREQGARWWVVCLVAAAGFTASLPADAQNSHLSGFVTGKVFAGESIVSGATVEIASNDTISTAVSDDFGRFFILNLPSGNYTIRAEFDGTVAVKDISLERGRSATHNIALSLVSAALGAQEPDHSEPQGSAEKVDLSQYLEEVTRTFDGWERADTDALLRGFDFFPPESEPETEVEATEAAAGY